MNNISLRVAVPICSFRKPYARDYFETERFPSPATVYGFLLSLVGEEDRNEYIGTKLAIAITKKPTVSKVLRTVWRIKTKNHPPGTGNNRRPEYQEILTDLEIGLWVTEGRLANKLLQVKNDPSSIKRFGGLSLGESKDLVDEVEFCPNWDIDTATWLMRDEKGHYPLPLWVDHVGSRGTNWQQFKLIDLSLSAPRENDPRWITIHPPR